MRREGPAGEAGWMEAVRREVVGGPRWRGRRATGVVGKARGREGTAGVSAKVRYETSGESLLVMGILIGAPLTWPTA